jgi:hypothetical protein
MGPWGCQEIGAAVPDKTQQSLRFGFPKRDCREWCAAQPAPVRCQSSWAIIAHRSHQQADFLIFSDVFFLSLAVSEEDTNQQYFVALCCLAGGKASSPFLQTF